MTGFQSFDGYWLGVRGDSCEQHTTPIVLEGKRVEEALCPSQGCGDKDPIQNLLDKERSFWVVSLLRRFWLNFGFRSITNKHAARLTEALDTWQMMHWRWTRFTFDLDIIQK